MSIQVVSFTCTLKNMLGQIISETYNREVLTGSPQPDAMLKGLSKKLVDLKPGEKRTISLSAEEAYGFYDPKKIILFPKSKLPKGLAVGQMVTIVSKTNVTRVYKVLQIMDSMVSLDGNHPLAGQDLVFEIKTLEARDATPEEIEESLNHISTQLLH